MQIPGVATGDPMMVTCFACNGLNLAGTLFCGMCGNKLTAQNMQVSASDNQHQNNVELEQMKMKMELEKMKLQAEMEEIK